MKTNTKLLLSTLALSVAMASTAFAQRGPGKDRDNDDRGRNDRQERDRGDRDRYGNQREAERKAANLVNTAYKLQNIVERFKDNRERITSPVRKKASFLVSKSRQLERVVNVKGVTSPQADDFMYQIKDNFNEMKGLLYGSQLGHKVRYEMAEFETDMKSLAREL